MQSLIFLNKCSKNVPEVYRILYKSIFLLPDLINMRKQIKKLSVLKMAGAWLPSLSKSDKNRIKDNTRPA